MSALVFDIEANGLHDATKTWCISTSAMDEQDIRSYGPEDLSRGIAELGAADEIIGHNITGFDIPHLQKLHGWTPNASTKITDTLAMSRVLNPDRREPTSYTGKGGPHSLECWGYRVCRAKPSHEDWTVYSPAMLQRNREDVAINKLVFDQLSAEARGHDWSQAFSIETEISRIITQQEIHGVVFDTKRATELVQLLDARVESIDSTLNIGLPISYRPRGVEVRKPFNNNGHFSKMVCDWFDGAHHIERPIVGGPFTRIEEVSINLNSIKQVKDYLLTQGWVPTQWNYNDDGDRTSPKLTEDSYGTIVGDFGKLVKDRILLRHRRGQIQGWIDRVRPDGRLSAYANPCGTNTGRMRHAGVVNVPKVSVYPKGHTKVGQLVWHTDPEFQSVPFGTEMRSLFTVPNYWYLIGHDAEQLELRLLAHYMNDPLYIQEILHGDIHTANQHAAGLDNRDAAKTFIYAFIYGAGDEKLGSIIGGDANDGAAIRRKFLSSLPSLERLIRRVKRAADKGWLRGLDNRKIFMRYGTDGRVMKHKALNTLLQGAGAVVMKQSAIILDFDKEKERLRAHKVLDMHDEAQHEVFWTDKLKFAELAEQSVVKAGEHFKLNIPMAATAKYGKTWAETH